MSDHVSRVLQLDASSIDSELFNVLKNQFTHAFKYINHSYLLAKFDAEINAVLKLLIWKFSVFSTNATIGHQMLNLKYQSSNDSSKICVRTKCLYAFLWIGIKWLIERSNLIPTCSFNYKWIQTPYNIFELISIINFAIFLIKGKYPNLVERILGLYIVPQGDNKLRQVSFDYMNRELLWHGLLDVLRCLLPCLDLHYITEMFKDNVFVKVENSVAANNINCALCRRPCCMPHHIGCNHVYCYYCLMNSAMFARDFQCKVCHVQCQQPDDVIPLMVRNVL